MPTKKKTEPKATKTTKAATTKKAAPAKAAAAAAVAVAAEPKVATVTVTMVPEAPVAPATPAPATAPAKAAVKAEDLTVGQFQRALAQKGFYTGAWDGDYGWHTKQAVRNFQAANGLPVDGEPTTATLVALGF